MTPGQLTEKIHRDKSTTTALVKKLEGGGFLKIEKSMDDCRKKLISLTEKGKKYNELTAGLSKELIETAYRNFSLDEKEKIFSLLTRISENLN